jgi:CubicO group peptidase (beta-lactamase class C family)
LPVDGDTLFQIGSTSKTFTATIAMRLAEMGNLSLDEPIRSYLPDFRLQDAEASKRATLRHCFTHTSGWLGDKSSRIDYTGIHYVISTVPTHPTTRKHHDPNTTLGTALHR